MDTIRATLYEIKPEQPGPKAEDLPSAEEPKAAEPARVEIPRQIEQPVEIPAEKPVVEPEKVVQPPVVTPKQPEKPPTPPTPPKPTPTPKKPEPKTPPPPKPEPKPKPQAASSQPSPPTAAQPTAQVTQAGEVAAKPAAAPSSAPSVSSQGTPQPSRPRVVEVGEIVVRKKTNAEYPMISRKRRDQGTVVLLVQVSSGKVVSTSVEKSSGHEALDASATRAVAGWLFDTSGFQDPLTVRIPFQFSLK